MGKFSTALKALSTKLVGTAPTVSDASEVVGYIAEHYSPTGSPIVSGDITDATTVGKAVLTAANAAAVRTAIGAGTSDLVAAAAQADSTASTAEGAVADLNALLAKLRTAGIIETGA